MKIVTTSTYTILLAAVAALGIATAAHATLLVYEPFNYPVGPLYGQSGGTGFSGAWSNSGTDGGYVYDETTTNVVAGTETGLTWDGKVNNLPALPSVGARYQGGKTTDSNVNIRRTLASSAGAMAAGNGGVLWMSAAYHLVNQGYGAGITLGLGNGYAGNRGASFTPATTSFLGANGYAASTFNYRLNALVTSNGWTAGAYAETLGTTALSSTLDLVVVLKYTFKSGTNTVETCAFTESDTLSEAAFYASASHVSATLIGGIDTNSLTVLSLAQGRIANAQDEIRIGTTFTDVITLPPAGPVSATISTVTATPASVLADGYSTSSVKVTLLDSIGVPVAGKSVTLADTAGPKAAIITPSGAQTTGANGQATFTVKSSTVGTEVFTATNTTDSQVITQTASVAFAPLTGDASVSTVVAFPANVFANGTFASTITVTVKSSGGFPMANKSVTLGSSPGIAAISPVGAQTTGTNGQVTFTATSSTVGTVVFAATNTTDSQVIAQTASVQFYNFAQWSNSAPFYILTTTNGAGLSASALETNFPILLRLNSSFFDFSQAKTNGADIRFTTASSNALPYEIEQWDAVKGTASIWVLVPGIRGSTNQQLIMFWGNTNAASQSSGPSVFNSASGYSCVMHMNGTSDSVGALTPTDSGTTSTSGMVGAARHFPGGAGFDCGQSITSLPSGNSPHTTEAWFRASSSGNTLVAWGIPQGQGKVVMQLASPTHINVDCWFSAGNVAGGSTLAFSQWYHVAHVYGNLQAQVYVNGILDGSASGGTAMAIPTPEKMYIGGWSQVAGIYDFTGDMDEVRISSLARSSNWMWMQYQNQNPVQTLVGHLVQPGSAFSVSPTSVTMNEGTTTNLTAQAGGAIKVYWLLKQNNQSTVIAADQLSCALAAGRVTGNQSYVVQFKAVYSDGTVRTSDIPVTVLDTIPDPVFSLAPSTNLWDGRQTMTVTPVISNWAALVSAGATNLNYNWAVGGVAVIKSNSPGVLTLLRSQGSGPMTVTLVIDNGGPLITNTAAITVQEPATDAWVVRVPSATEKAVDNQFYARDDTGFGTLYYNGTGVGSPDSVFLKVYANPGSGEVLYTNLTQVPSGGVYAFSVRIPAGQVTYRAECRSVTGTTTNLIGTATNLVCGDAYIIEGQSNAVTSQVPDDSSTNQWIRSYGASGGWGYGNPHGGNWSLGYWGWDLATNLVGNYHIPICIINGSVGGTRIDQHLANATNHFAPYGSDTIYADLLTRVVGANLTHGIRGLLWHQGEQDQGAAGPDGDYDYKFYQQHFVDLSAAWKQDYPNLRYYYLYQIWPSACGDDTANDMLREVQRTLPYLYSKMRITSTLGIVPGSSCHYSVDGYYQFFVLIGPLVAQDNYGFVPAADITAPDLKQAYFTTTNRNEIALVFGQDMAWNSGSPGLFYLDYVSPSSTGLSGKVASGSASGHVIKLQLTGPSTNQTITYVAGGSWNGVQTSLLYGSNGIAALTFASVPIAPTVTAVPPAITSLTPVTGRTNGGTVVTLTGSNFLSGATVTFGGASAVVTVNSSTQLTATTPVHAAGLVNVIVANTNALTATNQFTYVLPPAPATLGGAGLSGTNLTMVWSSATNPAPVLLMGTNIIQPRSTWTPVQTNIVGPGGLSTNTIPITNGIPQRFYLLSSPYN